MSEKKSDKKKNTESFNIYIQRVLKQVHPDAGISSEGLSVLNGLLEILIKTILKNVPNFLLSSSKVTINSREIQSAVILVLPRELAKHAVSEGTKAVTRTNAMIARVYGDKAPKSKSAKAGLTFSVSRVRHRIEKYLPGYRIGVGGPIYLAAVLEYLIAEIMELAGNAARDNQRVRIIPRHIMLSIRNDEELNQLFGQNSFVLPGGVIPNINPKLLKD